MKDLKKGDKVLFDGQILTLGNFDTWWSIWTFVEKSYPPVEYQKFDKPVKYVDNIN